MEWYLLEQAVRNRRLFHSEGKIQMSKAIFIMLTAMLLSLTATAQIPVPLQIAGDNGLVTVSATGSTGGAYGLGQFETTTDLTSPVVWTQGSTGWEIFGNDSFSIQTTNVQSFFRFVQSYPVFEFAVFYNMDLEVNPGAAMTINGLVHVNGNLWTTGSSPSSPLTYSDLVDASGTIYFQPSTNDSLSYSPGGVIFTVTTNNPLNRVGQLFIRAGTNASVGGILGLPPAKLSVPTISAYSPTGQVYLYNSADLIITNSPGGTNLTVLYDNQYVSPNLTPVVPDMMIVTNYKSGGATKYVTNFVYSFVTNATFYDYRESDTVQAIQLNVSNLVVWLTNDISILGTNRGGAQYNFLNTTGSASKGHGINSIYIYNSVPLSTTTLPAVRVVNGAQLPPAGLTVATAQPLYVKGNYNVQTNNGGTQALTLGSTINGATVPAALMGDAITVLSSGWRDSYNQATSLGLRSAQNTTINAACIAGIVPSFTDSGGTRHYSGGLENYFRLLESWSGDALTYNGSFAVMYPSQYATNLWISSGTYYNPPIRNWGFDVNFSKGQAYLPPLTPSVVNFIDP